MAEKRMFAKTIIDSDAFLEMPMSARLLYYDLAMRADDDGFINSPKKIMKIIGATTDDLNILILRKFIIPFENGVVVIKHWRIHNYIRKDTYTPTPYIEQKAMLAMDENKAYTLVNQDRGRLVDGTLTQIRVEENREVKDREDKVSEEECNTHAREEKNTYFDLEKNAAVLFRQWGNKNGFANMKVEWLNRFMGVPESNWMQLANLILQAVKAYKEEYKRTHPDEKVDYQYLKTMDKFFQEDLDYWMAEVERRKEC